MKLMPDMFGIMKEKQIVLMYFIQGMPFTFDEIDDWVEDPKLIELADQEKRYSIDHVYEASNYLIQEEVILCCLM